MSEFDKQAYEREQGRKRRRVVDTLLGMPEFQQCIDRYGRGPTVVLECPHGHRLMPVTVDVNDGDLTISPLPGHKARKSGRVTGYGEPWRHGKRPCAEPGCPVLVDSDGYCMEHGGDVERIGDVRTIFTCRSPRCAWSEPVTTVRLLQLYGLAVHLGQQRMPLGDTPG